MSNMYRQLIHQLPASRLSVDVLLALRLILDPGEEVKLQKEIQALATSPELLKQRLRPEWEAFVSKALVQYARSHSGVSSDVLFDDLLNKIEQIQNNDLEYQAMLEQVNNVKLLQANEIVQPDTVEAPWRQQVMALLLPVTTLDKSVEG
ncbi:hypothetical protein CA267_008305 [Alteromonas pelagimontana]|uniref:Uncharacterized protein n=1 Tax=Alteromonas pelagimontana TaxID=1858656 RepID=A0A6M4MD62_9ALTE|nr:hypothetical protein [Alteromonas pelagimontana]QJR80778.1 hypothetical protein CA267_008305 [Alteromonas pelagimontana]